jgi:hypothetical protein
VEDGGGPASVTKVGQQEKKFEKREDSWSLRCLKRSPARSALVVYEP